MMSDDLVRAEVRAVRALKHGIGRYSEQIRDACDRARRETAAAALKAQEAVDQRRSEAKKREQELRGAEAALRACSENCGGLQQQVHAAARRLAEAELRLGLARKAAHLTATAQSDLLGVLQTVSATVSENTSVASSALTYLDRKLEEYPNVGLAHTVHKAAAGLVVTVEFLDAMTNFGRVTGNALRAIDIASPVGDDSLVEMVQNDQEQERNYVIEQDFAARKRGSAKGEREDR